MVSSVIPRVGGLIFRLSYTCINFAASTSRMWLETVVVSFKAISLCLEGQRKLRTTNNLRQDSLSTGRHPNPGPPEYAAGVLSTRLRCSATSEY
jgi:hypothetical protein